MKYSLLAVVCFSLLFACSPSAPPSDSTPRSEIKVGDTVFLASGVKYVFIKKGEFEDSVTKENQIVTHINLYANGNQVWSTYDSEPFAFVLNRDPMIDGFYEVIMYMRKGDRIHSVIPPHLGYGASGNGPTIPPNATLLFDIEVLEIN